MENNLARFLDFAGRTRTFENANRKLENFAYRSVLFDDRHFCKKVQISKVEMKNGFFFFIVKLLRVSFARVILIRGFAISRCNIILAINIGYLNVKSYL